MLRISDCRKTYSAPSDEGDLPIGEVSAKQTEGSRLRLRNMRAAFHKECFILFAGER